MFQLTSLPQEEVLRYLGYRGSKIPPALEDTIGRCMEETCRLASPAYLYRHFSIAREEDGIRLVGTPYSLKGQDIRSHLAGCEEIYLLCATLGLSIDREIRLRMLTTPEEALILDAGATAAIEETADAAEEEIADICKRQGLGITWRFSPGYGDLPLSTQKWLPAPDGCSSKNRPYRNRKPADDPWKIRERHHRRHSPPLHPSTTGKIGEQEKSLRTLPKSGNVRL